MMCDSAILSSRLADARHVPTRPTGGKNDGQARQRRSLPENTPTEGAGLVHIDQEPGRPALGQLTFPAFHDLALFLAVLAPDGERQRAETTLGNLVAALEAVAVRAFRVAEQRLFDLVERLRLHLDECKLDVILNVGFRRFGGVEDPHTLTLGSLGADVPHLVLDFAQNLPPTLFKNVLEFGVAIPRGFGLGVVPLVFTRALMTISLVPSSVLAC